MGKKYSRGSEVNTSMKREKREVMRDEDTKEVI